MEEFHDILRRYKRECLILTLNDLPDFTSDNVKCICFSDDALLVIWNYTLRYDFNENGNSVIDPNFIDLENKLLIQYPDSSIIMDAKPINDEFAYKVIMVKVLHRLNVQIKFDDEDDMYNFEIYIYIISNLKKSGSTLSSTLNHNEYYAISIDDNTTLIEHPNQLRIDKIITNHCIYKPDDFIFNPNFKGLFLVSVANQGYYGDDDNDDLVGYEC